MMKASLLSGRARHRRPPRQKRQVIARHQEHSNRERQSWRARVH